MAVSQAEIKKQVEYYLSDKNLAQDKFFNEKFRESKNGWIDISNILNCNKVKQMKLKSPVDEIAEACKDSEEVEVDVAKKLIKRKGEKAVPALAAKKRDSKAAEKEEVKKEETKEDALPQLDERGNPILSNADFENPIIIHFKTAATEGFKVNWKEVEQTVRKDFPRLKIVYSRADPHDGDLAISSHRLNGAELEKLSQAKLQIQGQEFTFSKTVGDELKTFWQKQGGHYQFCIQPKLRNIKKQQKLAKQKRDNDEGEKAAKRGKISYEIAGQYYADILKVKSKARAILNLKKDGEKLTGNDEEFIKELLAFHEKGEKKLKDFEHFEVGEHPDFSKTRCFFVVRKDGTKEDFSISKCIQRLEQQS